MSTSANQRGGTTQGRGERGYRGGNRGRGRGGGESRGYQAGGAPYKEGEGQAPRGGRGGRGGAKRGDRGGYQYQNQKSGRKGTFDGKEESKKGQSAEDQFAQLFGTGDDTVKSSNPNDPKSRKESENVQALMDMLGGPSEVTNEQDDAIIIEDDAIVVDDAVIIEKEVPKPSKKEKGKNKGNEASKIDPKLKNLSDEEMAILNAAQQSKPLWMEEEMRLKYSKANMFKHFVREEQINFDLYDPDYMSVFEIFSQTSQMPFGQETVLLNSIDVRKLQEKPGGQAAKRTGGGKQAPTKVEGGADWTKKHGDDEDEDADPEWIEFDPDKQRDKFFGHVMEDEERLRQNVLIKKQQQQMKTEERKQKAIEQAKREQMTDEQRGLIAASKKHDFVNLEANQDKLREAEQLAAQIEAQSYSKFDQDFEKRARNRREDEILTDDQLVDLFSEMRKENLAKKQQREPKTMERFQPEETADDPLGDLNDELEAGRGEDSDPDELDGLIQAAGTQYKIGVAQPFQFGALEDEEENNMALEEEEEPAEDIKYYSDKIKDQLKNYRIQREKDTQQNQTQTSEGNLSDIFKSFQIVTQQRHKIKLDQISEFQPKAQENALAAENSLISSIFSQINPFAQYVIQDVNREAKNQEEEETKEALWYLHENLFKKNPTHQVNPDNLKKTSCQMFSVYKFYENPSMQVKSSYYRDTEDYTEVKELVPKIGFFDAPTEVKPQSFTNFNQSEGFHQQLPMEQTANA